MDDGIVCYDCPACGPICYGECDYNDCGQEDRSEDKGDEDTRTWQESWNPVTAAWLGGNDPANDGEYADDDIDLDDVPF